MSDRTAELVFLVTILALQTAITGWLIYSLMQAGLAPAASGVLGYLVNRHSLSQTARSLRRAWER